MFVHNSGFLFWYLYLGQIPVIQSCKRSDVVGLKLSQQVPVILDTFGIDFASSCKKQTFMYKNILPFGFSVKTRWDNPGPSDGKSVALHPHVF